MGRKKMKTEDKIDIRLRVNEEMQKQILEAAGEESTTVAGFIRSLIVKELRRRKREAAE